MYLSNKNMNTDKTKFKLLYDNLCKQYSKFTINEVLMQLRKQTNKLKEEYVDLTIQNERLLKQNKELILQNELLQNKIKIKMTKKEEKENHTDKHIHKDIDIDTDTDSNITNLKKNRLLACIYGKNKGKCLFSDFIPCHKIPLPIQNKLISIKNNINSLLPIRMNVNFGSDGKCRNNQSLGNQIPKYLKEQLPLWIPSIQFMKMKGSGYPDEKVKIDNIDIPFLWEWKSMYGGDGDGARIVITKFPNKRIDLNFKEEEPKYHLWICISYIKNDDNQKKITYIDINKIAINIIDPNYELNTKFELNTNMKQINENIQNGFLKEL